MVPQEQEVQEVVDAAEDILAMEAAAADLAEAAANVEPEDAVMADAEDRPSSQVEESADAEEAAAVSAAVPALRGSDPDNATAGSSSSVSPLPAYSLYDTVASPRRSSRTGRDAARLTDPNNSSTPILPRRPQPLDEEEEVDELDGDGDSAEGEDDE